MFEHHHGEGHDHEHGPGHDHGEHGDRLAPADPAHHAVSDALRVSFGLLKVVMVVLGVVYLLSGIVWGVPEQKVAVRVRFGGIVGETASEQLLRPGKVYFALPYPVEQVVLIPTSPQQVSLDKEFWYEAAGGGGLAEEAGRPGPLNPEKDGSLLTGDGNIIHARWTIKYGITNPILFMKNVAWPGSDERVVPAAAGKVVRMAGEQAVVFAAAQATAEEASRGNINADVARSRLQKALDGMGAGITVTDVTASKPVFPVSVREAFAAVINAENDKGQMIERARQEQSRVLNDTAGEAFAPLAELVARYEAASAAGDAGALAGLDSRLDWVFERLSCPRWIGMGGRAGDELWASFKAMDAAQRGGERGAVEAATAVYGGVLEKHGVGLEDRRVVAIGGKVSQLMNESRSYRSEVVTKIAAEAMAFNPQAINPGSNVEGLLQQYRRNPGVFLSWRLTDMAQAVLGGDVDTMFVPAGQVYLELSRDPAIKKKREEARLKAESEAGRRAGQ